MTALHVDRLIDAIEKIETRADAVPRLERVGRALGVRGYRARRQGHTPWEEAFATASAAVFYRRWSASISGLVDDAKAKDLDRWAEISMERFGRAGEWAAQARRVDAMWPCDEWGRTIRTTRKLRSAMDRQGSAWWKPGNMRFFGTRASEQLIGRFFWTSEQPPHGERAYTLRRVDTAPDGTLSIETIGDLCAYPTRSRVKRAAEEAHRAVAFTKH